MEARYDTDFRSSNFQGTHSCETPLPTHRSGPNNQLLSADVLIPVLPLRFSSGRSGPRSTGDARSPIGLALRRCVRS